MLNTTKVKYGVLKATRTLTIIDAKKENVEINNILGGQDDDILILSVKGGKATLTNGGNIILFPRKRKMSITDKDKLTLIKDRSLWYVGWMAKEK